MGEHSDLDAQIRWLCEQKQRLERDIMDIQSTIQFNEGILDEYGDALLEYISGVMTLWPGDVVSTGTSGGVDIFRDPPELLEPGDEVDVEIEVIGTLTNTVIVE